MKILVLGCNGMAGHVITQYLKEKGHNVYGLALTQSDALDKEHMFVVDATNFEELDKIIIENTFDYIINCVGILNQQTEVNKLLSITINSLLPHHLVKIVDNLETRVIHMSTDCVFSGKDGAYNENAIPDSTTFYGKTKSIGEIADSKNLTIRTSIVGPDINVNGIGLFGWFMKQSGNINGYTKAIWSGVTTIELAKIMELCMINKCAGLVNMVNNEPIAKYDLLHLFKKYFNRDDININKYDAFAEDKTLIRTNFELDYKVPSYEQMIKEMAEWVSNHKDIYNY